MRKYVLLAASASLLCAPAQSQPAQGYGSYGPPAPRARVLNPRDVAEAARDHPLLVQEMGGEETGPRAAYVASVGQRVGA